MLRPSAPRQHVAVIVCNHKGIIGRRFKYQPQPLLAFAQSNFRQLHLSEITKDFREAEQLPPLIVQRGGKSRCVKAPSILPAQPAIVTRRTIVHRILQFLFWNAVSEIFRREDDLIDGYAYEVRFVKAKQPFHAFVPAQRPPFRVHHKHRQIFHLTNRQPKLIFSNLLTAGLLLLPRGGLDLSFVHWHALMTVA